MNVSALTFFDWAGISTPLFLCLLAVAILLIDAYLPRQQAHWLGRFTIWGLVLIIFIQIILHMRRAHLAKEIGLAFGGIYYFDLYSIFFNYIFLGSAILCVALSLVHLEGKDYHRGEYYVLVLIAAAGMCILAGARDLIVLFLGLETMSIAVYVLAGIDRRNLKSNEAALKYLLIGAFATGFLLYGMALVYGVAGATDFQTLSIKLAEPKAGEPAYYLLLVGLGLFLVGFGFKIAAVPFHMWAPDVYEGAPTPITAYMATGVKAAGFAILVRIFLTAFSSLTFQSYEILYAMAVMTMTLGNMVAISQRNIKRMLAYSSIAHAGYLLVGITAITAAPAISGSYSAAYSIMFYVLVYIFMNIGAFAIVVAMGRENRGGDHLDDYAGLSVSRPFWAALMSIFMLSLTGIPPLGGFTAKLYLFETAISAHLYILVVIAVVNSVISAYYYLRVIYIMYMQPEKSFAEPKEERGTLLTFVTLFSAAMIIILGIVPNRFLLIIWKTFEEII
jgi:NADH-quinone oxidoreductase subunit N